MANIMSQVKLRNKTSREGFDLSKKNAFTAKVGELLPVYCKEVIPGDKFKINVQAFTRTMPVETAAFTRIREYYDFFFVPTNLMWNKFNTFVTSMTENNQSATSINENAVLTDQHPYFTTRQIKSYLYSMTQYDVSNVLSDKRRYNLFGFERYKLTCKLLHYLGYGDFYDSYDPTKWDEGIIANLALNPFPLLAYQKIYQDFYRHSQWEKAYAPAWNLNYISGAAGSLNIPVNQVDEYVENMFDLRYSNWNKDLFMGLQPQSQYGDAASIDLDSLINVGNASSADILLHTFQGASNGTVNNLFISGDSNDDWAVRYLTDGSEPTSSSTGKTGFQLKSTSVKSLRDAMGIDFENIQSKFTILALRQAEAKQKWAEITQSQNQDYKNQIEAHFGISPSDAYSERCKYLGGTASSLDISEVANTNLADAKSEPNIAGKGIGVTNGGIEFESKVHGYIMCVYHAVPLLDYAITGVQRQNTKTFVTDYAIPEFDATGMVSVPLTELTNTAIGAINSTNEFTIPLLGYAPRYYDYKQDIDEVHGAFYNGGVENWTAPVNDEFITTYLTNMVGTLRDSYITWQFMKVNPATLNPIFFGDATADVYSDQLLVNCAFNVSAVRNLDRNGLPF